MNIKKIMLVHILCSLFLKIFYVVYQIFSHNVTSESMSQMWIVPLISGLCYYFFYRSWPGFVNTTTFRILFNIGNTGQTLLVLGMMLTGIFEIAGTSSVLTKYYFLIGGILLFVTWVTLVSSCAVLKRRMQSSET